MSTSVLLLRGLDTRARDMVREAVSRERPCKTGEELAEWDFATVKRLLPLSILKVKTGSGASQYAFVPAHGAVKQIKSGDDLVTMVKLSYDGSNSGSYVEWPVLALLASY